MRRKPITCKVLKHWLEEEKNAGKEYDEYEGLHHIAQMERGHLKFFKKLYKKMGCR